MVNFNTDYKWHMIYELAKALGIYYYDEVNLRVKKMFKGQI